MTDTEFMLWKAWYLEPRGEKRLDWHYARLMHQFYAANRSKNSSAGSPQDWLIQFDGESEVTVDELRQKMELWAARNQKDEDGS